MIDRKSIESECLTGRIVKIAGAMRMNSSESKRVLEKHHGRQKFITRVGGPVSGKMTREMTESPKAFHRQTLTGFEQVVIAARLQSAW